MLTSPEVSDRTHILGLALTAALDPVVAARARRDDTGRIRDFDYVEVSESACQFLGRDRRELFSTSVRGAWPPEVADELIGFLAGVVDAQSTKEMHDVAFVTSRVETTGRFSIRASACGELVAYTYNDSREARELVESYRLLLANSSDVILRTDALGRIEWVFDTVTSVLGYDAEELRGTLLADLTLPEDEAMRAVVRDQLEGGDSARFRLRLKGKDGVVHHFGVLAHRQATTGAASGFIAGLHLIDHEVAATAAADLADERYRLMAEHGSDVIALERRGVIEWVSPFVERLLDLRVDDVIGRSLAELVHPDDRTSLQTFYRAPDATPPSTLTLRMLMSDSTYRWVSMRSREVVDHATQERVRVTSWRDAHDDVASQRALVQSESRFRMLAESVDDVVFACAASGEIEWASPSLLALLGRRPDEVVGRRLAELVYVEDRERAGFADESPARVATADAIEVRYLTSTGNLRWMLQRTRQVRGLSGEGDTLITALHDIDERVRQRQRIEETEETYRLLAENVSDVVYRVNLEGDLIWVSPSANAQLGWWPQDLIGHSVLDLIFVEDHARVLAWRRLLHLGETLEELMIRVRHSSGDFVWMKVHAQPTRGEGGRINGVAVALRNCEAEVVIARALRTISAGTRVLMRVSTTTDLLSQMCQVAVHEGGYLFAWYGKRMDDERSTVQVHATSVGHESYLEGIEVHWADDRLGSGPAGRAIRSGQICTVSDIDGDPSFAPWSEAARRHGFRSAAAIPVVVDGRVDGSWQVYAMEPRAFNSEVLTVLEDLALEIGFGLSRLGEGAR
ncbi:MAG: PAS domain S-box protein [Acidobacteriota bacterium]|nr:PAS domain S-box protein [Acidobacteriota bacterium]